MTNAQILVVGTSLAVAGTFGFVSSAAAQAETLPPGYESEEQPGGRLGAPRDAFELTLSSGYTRGVGQLEQGAPDSDVDDRAGNGVSFDLGLGARVSPRWSIGINGGYQLYETGDEKPEDFMTRGVTGRIDATYHFAPYARLNPWLKGGVGYRLLYEEDAPAGMSEARYHGFDLFNLTVGLDLRPQREWAIAPIVGADLTTFLWNGAEPIEDPRLSTFFYGGLQIRVDIGGNYSSSRAMAAAR